VIEKQGLPRKYSSRGYEQISKVPMPLFQSFLKCRGPVCLQWMFDVLRVAEGVAQRQLRTFGQSDLMR
jgi:hypothetical protein